jgi:peptidoglycan/xylan/chitin deacetylase (PgdA/CDA1 family)
MYKLFNRFQPFFSSHILLYHSTYKNIPDNIKKGLHNVDPETLYQQIRWLKKYFDIVSVDSLFDQETNKVGKLAVTFDDAYNSVFQEAIPVLKTLNVPCTIYINGITLNQKPFWRDKIRYLINRNLVEDFITFNQDFCKEKNIIKSNFYTQTKNTKCNSKQIDIFLDAYYEYKKISIDTMKYGISDKESLKKNSLITYGNHTYNHYVLSSLTKEEQEIEIRENQKLIKNLDINYSKVFSIPFGGVVDFNNDTIDLLKKYQYKAFLYSDNKINLVPLNQKIENRSFSLLSGERYMVKPSYNSFQKHLFKLGIKGLISHFKHQKMM